MTVAQPSEIVPLHTDADGVVRVGGTRVTLETLVAAFDRGSTAEEICEDFPGLELGDVYAVLTYTLRHRSEVDRYLADRRRAGDEIRWEIESTAGSRRLRERLLARRQS
ncbi:MAG TPA: DUF433 domain-containing protein [Thermoanaerobaculia bacterium]|nr:DUF433 domain-containing protein [Thermoanaerobaculia bacterium]